MNDPISIFWFRRDLRLDDNVGLYKALKAQRPVMPIFIFDSEILDKLPKDDARVSFIHDTVQAMRQTLQDEYGSSLAIFHGKPLDIFKTLIKDYDIATVYTNRDYEPYARTRDTEIEALLTEHGIAFHTFKDQVIFEKDEVVKKDGDPYVVYTPYMRTWKDTFQTIDLTIYNTEEVLDNLVAHSRLPNLSLSDIGFERSSQKIHPYNVSPKLIKEYEDTRNFPAQEATSRLGPHLRFGTVSVRKMMQKAMGEENETFWQELIWREFFMQILWHFPKTKDKSFKSKYDRIEWRNDEDDFKKWCEGKQAIPWLMPVCGN
jgi:deoxyribodipyrimidine photo-lyase